MEYVTTLGLGIIHDSLDHTGSICERVHKESTVSSAKSAVDFGGNVLITIAQHEMLRKDCEIMVLQNCEFIMHS